MNTIISRKLPATPTRRGKAISDPATRTRTSGASGKAALRTVKAETAKLTKGRSAGVAAFGSRGGQGRSAAVAERKAIVKRVLTKPVSKKVVDVKVSLLAPEFGAIVGMTALGGHFYVIELDRKIKANPSLPTVSQAKINTMMNRIQKQSEVDASHVNSQNGKFMAAFKSEAQAERHRLVADGALISSSELQARLEIRKAAVSKALKELRFFSIDGPGRARLYPAFFADPGSNRKKLEKISKELGDLPGPSKWQFFTTPKRSLDGCTPLEAIQKGQFDKVLSAATGFRER